MKSIISIGSRCQYNLMVSEGLITLVWLLPLQITSRVANVDDNCLTYNRPSQKIIREILSQLALFLPLKEFHSILQFPNVTDSSCKQFRWCLSLCQMGLFSKIPCNQSSIFIHQLFWKKNPEFLTIPCYHVEKKSKLMVLVSLSDSQLSNNTPRIQRH